MTQPDHEKLRQWATTNWSPNTPGPQEHPHVHWAVPRSDLEPFCRELDLAVLELSRRTRVPYSLLSHRPKPRLRDLWWSRLQTARRLLLRTIRR